MVHENKKMVLAGLEENQRRYGIRFCPCVAPYAYADENIPNRMDFECKTERGNIGCKQYREEGHCHCGLFPNKEVK